MDTQPRELNSKPNGLSAFSRPFPYVSAKTIALTSFVLKNECHVWCKRNHAGFVSHKNNNEISAQTIRPSSPGLVILRVCPVHQLGQPRNPEAGR